VPEDNHNKHGYAGVGGALGAGIGVAIGAATENIGVWIAIGAGMGAAIGAALTAANSGNDDDSNG